MAFSWSKFLSIALAAVGPAVAVEKAVTSGQPNGQIAQTVLHEVTGVAELATSTNPQDQQNAATASQVTAALIAELTGAPPVS